MSDVVSVTVKSKAFTPDQESFDKIHELFRNAITQVMEEHIGGQDEKIPVFVSDMMFQALLAMTMDNAAALEGIPEEPTAQTPTQRLRLGNQVRLMMYRKLFPEMPSTTPEAFAAAAEARWSLELDQMGHWWTEDEPDKAIDGLAHELGEVLLRLATQMFLNARAMKTKRGDGARLTREMIRETIAHIKGQVSKLEKAQIINAADSKGSA